MDENDQRELKLKRVSDAFNEDYVKAKDAHKEALMNVKNAYEKFNGLINKAERDLIASRNDVKEINIEFE